MTVKQKQWQLWYLGYYAGAIDGIWGSLSRQATVSYQKDSGLTADGVFGPLTEKDSMELICGIQKLLRVQEDGLAGENTKAATSRWQLENGLAADGIAGVQTRQAMTADEAYWNDFCHFSPEEFRCKCGGRYCGGYPAMVRRPLLEAARQVREHFGAAVILSSGLRCPQHNKNAGGVSGSRHQAGKAMDFRVAGHTASQVLEQVKRQKQIRYCYAIDANHVHMDVL